MTRKAFLLGFYSIGGQVLLLRELTASYRGDELFIGFALFGWLLAVALGAILGGNQRVKITSGPLFVIGIILLPASIIALRFSPFVYSGIIWETVPLSTAALIAIVLMFPVGLISGWLFPVINREGYRPSESIIRAYLFEGIGAFVGGVAIVALVGWVFSTLTMAMAIGILVPGFYFVAPSRKNAAVLSVVLIILLAGIMLFAGGLDRILDTRKYSPYDVLRSFDTHYGRQAILSRDDDLILVSDNGIEAVYPGVQSAEEALIPPLLNRPEAKHLLLIGRAEFGIMQVADSLRDIVLTAVDPRVQLTQRLDSILPPNPATVQIDSDPISFLTDIKHISKYDVVIIHPGEPDNYKVSRLITPGFLSQVKVLLGPNGLLYLPTAYDTDRHISSEKARIITIIHNTLQRAFRHVTIWPGESTLFFASDSSLALPNDSVAQNGQDRHYAPVYVNEYYLPDRFTDLKLERLAEALSRDTVTINELNRPVLPHFQALYQAKARGADTMIIPFLLDNPFWLVILPALMLVFFIATLIKAKRRRFYGLFLYFTAGIVSLTLELLSFYVFQAQAGSLYAELGILIGAFMFGLAVGTFYSHHTPVEGIAIPALLMLLTASTLFLTTFDHISAQALVFYHALFLFSTAVATGTLFVAATRRYYFGKSSANRGLGYAVELVGSSVGALFAMTVFLPILGLGWLLGAIVIFLVITLVGVLISS
ncbi:MAG: hypothetical protein JW763_02610 [candidate division Zixibacteria bacterium]|nr:hypothetical protein [candidate division Zixibacteria bacterium]